MTGWAAWITVGRTAGALDPSGHWVGLFKNTLFRDSEKKKAELKDTWVMKAEGDWGFTWRNGRQGGVSLKHTWFGNAVMISNISYADLK